ncbi:hypothetical protein AR457_05760 [Streptomyces agglomeratus]|uniref:Uncharacterized protein n=1 Tax=Streptomyces agglomeratus TaxID=285458 RepID=A0A1E5P3X3_9ACTN|nr:hypothetical protein [Streptomyces agglomeratus]OEJ24044.1 hypothetical protein AS594_05690 [Streptomyces agglomeratus]OEJ41951.1 hypothetical protein BGK70_30880 [Streptomyces agglomeratus]OEJ43671.1 hypothetical protein AR457_05760 [Streptomyces agglomeratus]OEJ54442.1 hypothetical protein BGK72_30195 [Streptomyces agglomeratus]OEJ61813.1 hypothetical protein BGM19_31100 [Streptomyces agglomeratus]
MGDAYVWVADVDARPEEAAVLAGRVMDWLERRGIVRSELTNCLTGDELGRAPGPYAARAVTEDEVTAGGVTADGVCGVGMEIERRVYVCAGFWTATCPACGATTEPAERGPDVWTRAWAPLLDDLYAWFGGTGPGSGACVRCGERAEFTAWAIEPPVAVAHLGLVLWNWPPLGESFLDELSAVLGGHRLVTGSTTA